MYYLSRFIFLLLFLLVTLLVQPLDLDTIVELVDGELLEYCCRKKVEGLLPHAYARTPELRNIN